MPIKDGPSCSGCGLPNYSGFCPYCRGDLQAYEDELVPPFSSSIKNDSEEEELDKVEAWHNSDSELTLREWLGMSEEEFAQWVVGFKKEYEALKENKNK